MKRKMKWMALLLSCLILGGCGITDVTQMSGSDQVTEEVTDESMPTGASQSDEEAQMTDTSDETQSEETSEALTVDKAPVISIDTEKKEWYLDDTTILLLEVSNSLVRVENTGYEALNVGLQEHFPGIDMNGYAYEIQTAKEHYEGYSEEDREYFYGYYSTEQAELARCDSSVVSFRLYYSDYTGGAHGMYTYSGKTFDAKTGELLELSDILTDAEGFYKEATPYIAAQLHEKYGDNLFAEYEDYVAGTFGADRSLNWYLDAAGIVIAYTPYEVGPYAMGSPEVTLPYAEFDTYMNGKYLDVNSEMIVKVPADYDVSKLIGAKESLVLQTEDNEWDMLNVKLVSGDIIEMLGEYSWIDDAYIVKRADGRIFVLVACDYMSDDLVTFVYEVTDGDIRECSKIPGAHISDEYWATDRIGMVTRLDVLGTYGAKQQFILDQEGRLLQTEDIYTIDSSNNMTVLRELPVIIEGVSATLSVGTEIVVTGTNNAGEVYFKVINSDITGTIQYTMDAENEWIHLIDGVSEYEYFDMLPYAG